MNSHEGDHSSSRFGHTVSPDRQSRSRRKCSRLGDKPVIHYVVAEAAAAGFDEILIILSRGKEAIIQYFTPESGA